MRDAVSQRTAVMLTGHAVWHVLAVNHSALVFEFKTEGGKRKKKEKKKEEEVKVHNENGRRNNIRSHSAGFATDSASNTSTFKTLIRLLSNPVEHRHVPQLPASFNFILKTKCGHFSEQQPTWKRLNKFGLTIFFLSLAEFLTDNCVRPFLIEYILFIY